MLIGCLSKGKGQVCILGLTLIPSFPLIALRSPAGAGNSVLHVVLANRFRTAANLQPLAHLVEVYKNRDDPRRVPQVSVSKYEKNGHTHNGKQNHPCKGCSRQSVDGFEQYLGTSETPVLIERLLLKHLS